MNIRSRIVIFAKAPLPGLAKTRLIPALGAAGAAQLAQRMLSHTVAQALEAQTGEVELCVSPDPDSPLWQEFRDVRWKVHWQAQGGGDLGERLARAAERVVASGSPVLLIGTDCPALTAGRLHEAAQQLATHDAAMIPSRDGGYVLLGLNRFDARLFTGVAWSTDQVAAMTLDRIAQLRWSVACLPTLQDIDEPGDLAALPPDWIPEGIPPTRLKVWS